MAMRLTGLMSGMDTESMISQLVEAKSAKLTTQKKEQTRMEWKQEAWKDLNKKIKSFQTKHLSNMRFTDAYLKKNTRVSDSSAVSVITGENAVNGVQNLEINKLAKTAYLTGSEVSKIDDSNKNEISALTKLGDLIDFASDTPGERKTRTITFNAGGEEKSIELKYETTISDVLSALKEQGVNANFDAKQKRFFISAKESGASGNFTFGGDEEALKGLGLYQSADPDAKSATYIAGQDAEITLNGATFKSKDNVFVINGLTFTALNETNGKSVTVTTAQDTDGIYDLIKDFLKDYNELINEIDKFYNADSAKDYAPLTDDEKQNMSDAEVEKYEKKIKDALLRRDDQLSSVGNMFKQNMMKGFEVDGKTMYLSSFGIETLSYFTAPENQKNAYHISGNPDDEDTASKEDKLKSMIASEPDKVVSFFTQLARNLYSEMDGKSKAVEDTRSYGSFYDDKKMKKDYDESKNRIKEMEKKIAKYEDSWYSKFAKMESAMAKMQSGASALTNMLGGS